MPPLPKPAALRQRRNKSTTKATLPTSESSARNRVPAMPKRAEGAGDWHPMVKEWWASVWRSPMASEFLDADMRGGLYLLADLYQIRWTERDDARALVAAATEIRLQEVRFGLSPVDRRRLQWEVEKGESAAERTSSRKAAKRSAPRRPVKDPRDVLKVVA